MHFHRIINFINIYLLSLKLISYFDKSIDTPLSILISNILFIANNYKL
jgi:hypothetical protein